MVASAANPSQRGRRAQWAFKALRYDCGAPRIYREWEPITDRERVYTGSGNQSQTGREYIPGVEANHRQGESIRIRVVRCVHQSFRYGPGVTRTEESTWFLVGAFLASAEST
eukprot:1388463-Pyramimonas_sp.AAC.1